MKKDLATKFALTLLKPIQWSFFTNTREDEQNLFGLYREKDFHQLLVYERKRSERSQKPFILLLVDVSPIFKEGNRKQILRKLAYAASASSREIDQKGWYKKNHTMGIIYVSADISKTECIATRTRQVFSQVFSPELSKNLTLSLLIFPEGVLPKAPRNITLRTAFYPENTTKSSILSNLFTFAKRLLDIFSSMIGIILFSPLFLVVAILIKYDSKGPILFKQPRLGKGGKPFTFIKFRSMYVNNDDTIHKEFVKQLIANGDTSNGTGDKGVYKIKNDPRVTPIGRFLRASSLDELPQLFNVLLGDMSIVGPRPCLPYEAENYRPWHLRRILEVKPGITGIWQVEGRSSTTFDTMVRMDIQYILNQSLLLDFFLIFKTFFAVAKTKGAY